MMGTVPDRMKLVDVADSASLSFECGYLPADAAISATGHEPNGYFWEGVVEYLAASLIPQIELDPEAGMFRARGDHALLAQLRETLEGYLEDPERIARLIRQAENSGFHFDD
jgi:hypothetical protein